MGLKIITLQRSERVDVITGDESSVKMAWKNIVGDNFNNSYDHWCYLENNVFSDTIGSSTFFLMDTDTDLSIESHNIIYLPNRPNLKSVSDFSELFSVVGTTTYKGYDHRQSSGIMTYSDADIKMTDLMKNFIENTMIYGLTGDSYYLEFQEVFSKPEKTRVTIKYSKIIGSRFVAYIDTDSLPDWTKYAIVTEERKQEIIEKGEVNGRDIKTHLETAIQALNVVGNSIMLPSYQVDRKTYAKLKIKIEDMGGKWKGKTQTFDFKSSPKELLDKLKSGEKVNIQQEFQFFETPKVHAQKIVDLAEIKEGHKKLEPSAGKGRVAELMGDDVDVCEFMQENRDHLKENYNFNHVGEDFLKLEAKGVYDRIVANPPFTKNQDIDHVMHMLDCLKEGGRLVSIMSASWTIGNQKKQKAFRELLKAKGAHVEEVESGAFKESGTTVKTMIVVIDK